MGNNRARLPLKPAAIEPARGKSQGLPPKGPRASDSHQHKAQPDNQVNGPVRRRLSPHMEADISQSDRDALAGLPFS